MQRDLGRTAILTSGTATLYSSPRGYRGYDVVKLSIDDWRTSARIAALTQRLDRLEQVCSQGRLGLRDPKNRSKLSISIKIQAGPHEVAQSIRAIERSFPGAPVYRKR